MKRIIFFCMLTVAIFSSCSKETIDRPNPLPGDWAALNVDYLGYPVDFYLTIYDDFRGEVLFSSNDAIIGKMEAYSGGALYETATVYSCIYNSRTQTGEFIVVYNDDDPDTENYTLPFLYNKSQDKFTVIQLGYCVTFSRK